RAARRRGCLRMARREPVARPLPDVAADVVESVAVRRKRADRRGALVTVELQVLPGERALPRVGHRLAAGELVVAPGEHPPVESAAGRELPLSLGREALAGPAGVRLRILVGRVHARMAV